MICSIRSRFARTASMPSRFCSACSAAAPKPDMAARFSVPARWPFSWPPPRTSGAGIMRSALATMAPAPFGPPILCDDKMR